RRFTAQSNVRELGDRRRQQRRDTCIHRVPAAEVHAHAGGRGVFASRGDRPMRAARRQAHRTVRRLGPREGGRAGQKQETGKDDLFHGRLPLYWDCGISAASARPGAARYHLRVPELASLLERFRRGPELLAVLLTGVFGEEEDFTLAPGKWSIRQIVAHLADA